MTIATRIRLFCLPLAALLLTSCTGYRLGTMLPDNVKTVYVPVVQNSTDEPLLENYASQAILRQLQRDGSLKVVDEAAADSILYVDLTDVILQPMGYDSDNRVKPGEYRMVVYCDIELIRTSDETKLVRYSGAEGKAIFTLSSDMTASKEQAFPDVTEDLAQDVVEKVTEAWPESY